MKKIKSAIALIATFTGFTSLTEAAGSRFLNLTFRTIKGTYIAELGANPTTAQIAHFHLNNCTNAPTQICAYGVKDGSFMPVDFIKGKFLSR
ncbi:hypothetical protein [Chitinophaga nivalis]|uniref:CHRD domain-containing protein n=1 Tax=Chitinophaga nivalis TaxID=2991709 RepID=A0ABT3IQQ1_9BACT|nr:hypothetical protein [Chitinophaga nivalis]MCW3464109.1 hypothetical protein [Chitinophaga nivalis]MCW3486201.1 hypothetical protein [Chitinophaga nivalis]